MQKTLHAYEFFFGILVSVGMILFAVADSRVSPIFSVLGITLVSLSVIADAFLPNVQVARPSVAPLFVSA